MISSRDADKTNNRKNKSEEFKKKIKAMKRSQILHVYEKEKDWENAVLDFITDTIADTLSQKDFCSISLSGGSTPKRIYELLADSGSRRGIDWSSVQLFWGDERGVSHQHRDSNYRMVREALLDHTAIPEDQIFPIPNPEDAAGAAGVYELILQKHFPADGPSFDLCLLGMGDDGHTASIFPHTPLVSEKKAWVKEVYLKDQDTYRISVTAPVINRSERIAFLIKGANKAKALKEVLDGKSRPEEYPSQLIRKGPEVHYFLDKEAAREIE